MLGGHPPTFLLLLSFSSTFSSASPSSFSSFLKEKVPHVLMFLCSYVISHIHANSLPSSSRLHVSGRVLMACCAATTFSSSPGTSNSTLLRSHINSLLNGPVNPLEFTTGSSRSRMPRWRQAFQTPKLMPGPVSLPVFLLRLTGSASAGVAS